MIHSQRVHTFKPRLAALLAAAGIVLAACGGGSGTEGGVNAPGQTPPPASPPPGGAVPPEMPPAIQSVSTGGVTTVSIGASSNNSAAAKSEATKALILDFEGKVTEGPSKDTELKGKLLLRGTSADEGKTFTLEGKLVQRGKSGDAPQVTPEQRAKIEALIKKFQEDARALNDALREAINKLVESKEAELAKLREQWMAINPTSPDAQQKYKELSDKARAVVEDFRKQLTELLDKFQADIKALHDKFRDDLKALLPAGGMDGAEGNVINVSGKLAEDGKISLTFDLGAAGKIEGTGAPNAEGDYSGTFTGPKTGDKGAWTAEAFGRRMPPVPGPIPPIGAQACPAGTQAVLQGEISEVKSATSFNVGRNLPLGPMRTGVPVDTSAAKYVNGVQSDIAVGKAVRVCGNEPIAIKDGAIVPVKATVVEFLKRS
jgi:ElaB/YqjD/DUF883 family membrane-anchored ribosome-binding protein